MVKVSPKENLDQAIKNIYLPGSSSHKGQNGKLLIIGGSSLFHSASLWAAEVASHFVDLVHYSSTIENEKIFINLKSKFTNGIIVQQKDLLDYAAEDDCILIGPGMMRGETNEAKYTYDLTKQLIEKFPDKRFVLDAGALQMMDKNWLKMLEQPAIITPHAGEFTTLFGANVTDFEVDKVKSLIENVAQEYQCTVLLKTIIDIVSDGSQTVTVSGGNAGLTKGGSGDVLAGLAAALYTKNGGLDSGIIASYLVKSAGEALYKNKGYWYNTTDLIDIIPALSKKIVLR